jgi:hypothetical protein
MMTLPLIAFTQVALGLLSASLAILVLIIAYRKFLTYLGRGAVPKEAYAVLYPIKDEISTGNVDLYYESKEPKPTQIVLLNEAWEELAVLDDRESKVGGNKVVFDTSAWDNGVYFFCLKTNNQKTTKKIYIENPASTVSLT